MPPSPDSRCTEPPENAGDQAKRLGVGRVAEDDFEPTEKEWEHAAVEFTPLDSPLSNLSSPRRNADPTNLCPPEHAITGVPPEKARTGGDQLAFNPKAARADGVPD